ncbi:hypothetical protein EON65_55315, partial [archaeon]
MMEEFDGTETLCVSLERKNKPPIFTTDKNVLLNDKDEIVATFNELLTTYATLYLDGKTSLWQEKSVRLSVLQRKQGVLGMKDSRGAFKTIGLVSLPLHEICDCRAHEMDLPLSLCVADSF